MLVAYIAERELNETKPEIAEKARNLILRFDTKKERHHVFTESATFADVYNYKLYGAKGKTDPFEQLFYENADLVNTDAHWHFADTAYYEDITEEEA